MSKLKKNCTGTFVEIEKGYKTNSLEIANTFNNDLSTVAQTLVKKVENAKYYSDFIDENNEKTFFRSKLIKMELKKQSNPLIARNQVIFI